MPEISIAATIETAIAEKRLLQFEYGGVLRIAEPHVLGVFEDKEQLLAFQIAGETVGGGELPNWRRVDLEKLANLVVLDAKFAGPRATPGGSTSSFDRLIAVVD